MLKVALSLAEPEGYVRIFVDAGTPMARLLRHAASRGLYPPYVRHLLTAFDGTETPMQGAKPQPLIEPLSERELEVLYSTPQCHSVSGQGSGG